MNLTYDALDKNIATELKPLYLLYGEEQYLIDTCVNKIKKKFGERVLGINYILIDETNIDSLISDIEMPAFGYDKKLIIVKDSGLFKKDGRKKSGSPIQDKVADYIKNNMDIIEESVILVFVETNADKNVVFEQVEKQGIVCNIEELKPIQLVKKLKQICNLYKVNVDELTLNYLVETIDAVNKLSIKQIESIIFDLTDNLAIRKIDKALEILDGLIYQKEPIQRILVVLYGHFKKIYLCAIAVKLNKDVVNSLNLKPNQTFLVTKYKKQASHFKLSELRNILDELVELDYNFKNGKIDVDVGLRSILCRYCS